MFDYIRAACCVPDVSVGNVTKNTAEILQKIDAAIHKNADLILLPELCVTGYTCADLFFQSSLLNAVQTAINTIAEHIKDTRQTIVLGAPLKISGQLYNCALVFIAGSLCGIVPKTFLSTNPNSSENRWFVSSEALTQQEVSAEEIGFHYAQKAIPCGRNLIFTLPGSEKMGIEIAEDLWAPIPPSSFLALHGAEIIVNLSADPEIITKREYRHALIQQQSAQLICAYLYVSAGCNESTSDLIFSGDSVLAENGSLLKTNANAIDSNYLLLSDIDMEKIRIDRQKNKSFANARNLYVKTESVRILPFSKAPIENPTDGSLYPIEKYPFIPSMQELRIKRCLSIFEMQVCALKKRLAFTKCKPVIGVSGGLDSTLALLVCVEAVKRLNKNPTEVIALTMPGFGTTSRTYTNSLALMQTLGVTHKVISIKDGCIQQYKDIEHDVQIHDITYENVQARKRTSLLMDMANKMGGLVIGTGDLSELALGWCTYNGDQMSMYGVNAGIPKTLLYWIIDTISQTDAFSSCREILLDIIETPISPELLPPDENGKIAQKTEDSVGPYALHDFFLYYFLRFGFTPSKIYMLAQRAFQDTWDAQTIYKWLNTFIRRFFSQQYKRNPLPDSVKIGSIGLNPRGDFCMPSDSECALWLADLEKIAP